MADTLLSMAVVDADGDSKRVQVFLPAATTQAAIVTFSDSFSALLDAVIDGQITDISYTISVPVPGGLKASPVANSEVQKGALFSFLNASRYKWGQYIPTWIPANFTGDEVDLEATGVAAFLAAYTAGLAGTNPTNGYSDDLTSLAGNRKAFRK